MFLCLKNNLKQLFNRIERIYFTILAVYFPIINQDSEFNLMKLVYQFQNIESNQYLLNQLIP